MLDFDERAGTWNICSDGLYVAKDIKFCPYCGRSLGPRDGLAAEIANAATLACTRIVWGQGTVTDHKAIDDLKARLAAMGEELDPEVEAEARRICDAQKDCK